MERYWRIVPGQGWRFENQTFQLRLLRHEQTKIVRHAKVQGARSPFDGDWVYWSSRLGRYPGVMPWVARLLKRQQGKCLRCGLYFEHGDATEVDHRQARSQGGTNSVSNLQLLHRHCHHGKTSEDKRGVHDKYLGTEEPDAGKLARPVLESSLGNDTPA